MKKFIGASLFPWASAISGTSERIRSRKSPPPSDGIWFAGAGQSHLLLSEPGTFYGSSEIMIAYNSGSKAHSTKPVEQTRGRLLQKARTAEVING
jgi:hypothetical protein